MVWILGIALFLLFWFIFPPFRKFALVAGGAIVVGILLILFITNEQEQSAKTLIPINQVQLNNLRLGKQYSSQELTGEVKNNSGHQLFDVYLKVTAFDCPGSSITSSCTAIGEDDHVDISVNVPPNQVRAINYAYVYLSNMPQVRGTFLWSYEITGTRGK